MNMSKKYIYGFDINDKGFHRKTIWTEEEFDTKEACVADAKECGFKNCLIFIAEKPADRTFPSEFEFWDVDTGEKFGPAEEVKGNAD